MFQILVPDNEGREFIFAFGPNYERYSDSDWGGTLEVFITTRSATPVAFNYTSSLDGITHVGIVRRICESRFFHD